MSDLSRDVRKRLERAGGPMTEADLAKELKVSRAEIREAAGVEETVLIVADQEERTYEYRLLSGAFVDKIRDAENR